LTIHLKSFNLILLYGLIFRRAETAEQGQGKEAAVVMQATEVRSYKHFINGEWVDPLDGETIPRNNPATGALVAEFASGNEEDTRRAIAAARRAFYEGPWPRMSGNERGRLLYMFAQKMREEEEKLAIIDVEETGKTVRFARDDIDAAIALVEYAAGLASQVHGEVYSNLGENYNATVVREPAGVAGLVIPWNFPALIFCQKAPFALAAGCTVVVKPSEFTSGSALELARMAKEAGIPDGVLNVVTGVGRATGQVLAESPDVDVLSFTGSTATGRRVMEAATSNLKKLSLELGGKAANIVFADADLEDALDGVLFGIYFNQGECCVSGTRLLVEDSIADEFMEKLVERAASLKVGDPMDEQTDIGALINPDHMKKVLGFIEKGRNQGATLRTGGERLTGSSYDNGAFVAPTIFDDVRPEMEIFQEEIFGPVLTVSRFGSKDEAIEEANAVRYGLANSVWTKNLDTAMLVSRALRSGTVWVNCTIEVYPQTPFGGYKESGFGREMGRAGMEEFTEVKNVLYHLGKREPFFGGDRGPMGV
jgi:betaine-aldehyde dehydrogenase